MFKWVRPIRQRYTKKLQYYEKTENVVIKKKDPGEPGSAENGPNRGKSMYKCCKVGLSLESLKPVSAMVTTGLPTQLCT